MELKTIGGSDGRYWILYEGTPGGSIESSDSLHLSTGNKYSIDSSNPFGSADISNTSGIASGSEWMYVTDGTLDRSLYMAITDENDRDTYYLMENNMTVFGFGRLGTQQLRTDENSILVFGLVEDKSAGSVQNQIDNSWNKALAADPGDVTPPVISNVNQSVTHSSTTITWTTDEPATSRIDYGLTSTYTDFEEDAVLKTDHSIVLNNLSPVTEYHFQVNSSDSSGNVSTSTDLTYTTEALVEIVSDDFSSLSLNTSLWTLEDPIGGASVSMTGSQAIISIPGGQIHDPWIGGNTATRLMQPASDTDFEVEVNLSLTCRMVCHMAY